MQEEDKLLSADLQERMDELRAQQIASQLYNQAMYKDVFQQYVEGTQSDRPSPWWIRLPLTMLLMTLAGIAYFFLAIVYYLSNFLSRKN